MDTTEIVITVAVVIAILIFALLHTRIDEPDNKPAITNYDTGIDLARELYREACAFAKVTFDVRHSIEKGYDLEEDRALYNYHEELFLTNAGRFMTWAENRGIQRVQYDTASTLSPETDNKEGEETNE